MKEFVIGGFVISKAGHDFGKIYVIIEIDKEYLYLVDGKIRTIDRPKKKKMKHVNRLNYEDLSLSEKIKNNLVRNEEIKRAIKMLTIVNSSKEVE